METTYRGPSEVKVANNSVEADIAQSISHRVALLWRLDVGPKLFVGIFIDLLHNLRAINTPTVNEVSEPDAIVRIYR